MTTGQGGYVTKRQLTELASTLSDREWSVLSTLAAVRLASAAQLERLHFSDLTESVSRARWRRRVVRRLIQNRLVMALPRRVGGVRAGSAGLVLALDIAGQRLAEQRTGIVLGTRPRRPSLPGQAYVEHTLAVTDVLVQLVEQADRGAFELRRFDAEPNCWRSYSGAYGVPNVLRADAYCEVIIDRQHLDSWFIEVDRGTESLVTVEQKLKRYADAYRGGLLDQQPSAAFPRLLFCCEDEARCQAVAALIERSDALSALVVVGRREQAGTTIAAGGQPLEAA